MVVGLTACAPELDGVSRALGTADAWEALGPEDDPLPSHRPEIDDCAPGGWYPEGGHLEVQTGICHYLTLGQPVLDPVAAGDPLDILVWHQDLDAPEPAEAHVALFLDGALLWEATTSIPADAAIYEEVVWSPVDASAGAWLVLHLHNHGYNTWSADVPHRREENP